MVVRTYLNRVAVLRHSVEVGLPRFARTFGSSACPQAICRCREVCDSKKSANCCEAFAHELRGDVRKDE